MEKLRRALEKAKQEKAEEKGEMDGKDAQAFGPEEDKAGRLSPAYFRSQSYKLDPKALADNRLVCFSSDSLEIEFYKILRTKVLQRTRPNRWNTIMITSALPGEGKTLTAINLALTFAREFNNTVLLVDCDFRQQHVHKAMGIPSEQGLIDALMDGRPLQELIIWPGIERLTLISGGRTITDTSEVLSSAKMGTLVSEIKSRYPDRHVFFDVPPVLSVADAMAFAPLVDAILMVVWAEKTSLQDVKRAVELIPKEKFLGFVLNRQSIPPSAYYGAYYQRSS